jgi:hypothetical protein
MECPGIEMGDGVVLWGLVPVGVGLVPAEAADGFFL